ncbi:hypothetical protein EBO34_09755 [Alteribacter keqinensis]|uniref:Uncharacterized protein n=1 Tax=Alteribacter keqinensis TaxID=2483800 RepID=A0A3M7TX56_9BACI|nr:hypothetical protein EBO34_09755 [Alteribacter keqinensis]
MVLLDERVKEVTVYRSEAVGAFSDEELMAITKPDLTKIFERAVRSAVISSGTPGEQCPTMI